MFLATHTFGLVLPVKISRSSLTISTLLTCKASSLLV